MALIHSTGGGRPSLERVFDGSRNAMLIADDARRYTAANDSACVLLETPRERLLTLNIDNFTPIAMLDEHRFDFHLRFVMSGDPDHIVIDLRGLSFIDSSGIELLLGADALSRQGGFRLWIISGEGQVKQALDICGVADRLPLCDEPPVLPD